MFKTKKVRPAAQPGSDQYTSTDVARICGVSLRQLQWWDERNVVSPRQDGHKRVYLAQEEIGGRQVALKVLAAELAKEGGFPGLTYPRVPGHEVVGTIDKLGAGVTPWKVGQRVGVGTPAKGARRNDCGILSLEPPRHCDDSVMNFA